MNICILLHLVGFLKHIAIYIKFTTVSAAGTVCFFTRFYVFMSRIYSQASETGSRSKYRSVSGTQ